MLSYIIQVMLLSAAFALFYEVLLKQHTFFRQNRFYLLFSFLFAIVIPFLRLPQMSITGISEISFTLNEVVITASETSQAIISQHQIAHYFYYLVVAVLLLRLIIGLIRVWRIRVKSEVSTYKGISFYKSNENINPFSIFSKIYLNAELCDDEAALERVLLHEKAHIKQFHSIDVMVSEVLCAIFWINPTFWYLKKQLKSTHEYLADEKVLEQDFDLAGYFMLIFNNVVGENVGFANNFSQSLNIKRMKMMKKKRSSRFSRIMSFGVIPLFFTLVFLVNCQVSSGVVSEIKTGTKEISAETNLVSEMKQTTGERVKKEEMIFMVVEKMPKYPGGTDELIKFLQANVKYPDEAKKKGITGRVIVEFVIGKDGTIRDVKVLESIDPLLDNEAIRVVKLMPKWEPGVQKGNKVSVSYRLPVNFALN